MPCAIAAPKECSTFDGEIENLIRAGIVDFETGLTLSTNAGNLA